MVCVMWCVVCVVKWGCEGCACTHALQGAGVARGEGGVGGGEAPPKSSAKILRARDGLELPHSQGVTQNGQASKELWALEARCCTHKSTL